MFVARSSSVKRFERCARRWRYAEDEPEPMTAALEIGTAVHKHVEDWLTKGTPFPATKTGIIAKKGVPFLPPPSPELRVELTDVLQVSPGVQFRRTIDLFDPIEPRLYDHKTFSQARYIPTPAQLHEDVQCTSYAWYAMELAGADKLNATWLYYPKQSGNCVPVELVFEKSILKTRWVKTLESIKQMSLLLEQPPEACDTNYDACNDYHRQCPFYNKCKGVNDMGLMDKMRKNLPVTDVPAEAPTLLERQLQASIVPPDAPPDTFEAMPAEETPSRKPRAPKKAAKEPFYPAEKFTAVAESYVSGSTAMTYGEAKALLKASPTIVVDMASPTLWIGAIMDGVPYVHVDVLAGPIADKVAADAGVPHFGLVEYGKGAAMLAVAFSEYLDSNPPGKPIFIDRVPSAIGKAVQEVLVRKAGAIARGV